MFGMISKYWWTLALRGVAAILFGIAAFAWPEMTLATLVLFFGAYALVDGIFNLAQAFGSDSDLRWLFAFAGITGIAIGIATFVWPAITALTLVYLIASWAIVTGIIEVVEAIRLRKVIENEWLLVISGILSVVFGVTLAVSPGAGALAMLWVIAAYAMVFGVIEIVLGFRLRSLGQSVDESSRQPTTA